MPVNYGLGTLPKLGGGSLNDARRIRMRTLSPEAEYRRQRSHDTSQRFDTALGDPTGTADMFGDYFQRRADALSAGANREFGRTIGTVSANIGSRFGGNASTYEQSQVNRAGDVFSRNLTEQLAGLAPEQAQLGLQYTGMLGDASAQQTAEYDQILQMIQQALQFQRQGEKDQKKGGIAGAIGGALGGIASGFLPGVGDFLARGVTGGNIGM